MYSCKIVCCSNLHEPIGLQHEKPFSLGRGPVTKIKDPRLSRNHIEIIPDCKSGLLRVKLLGSNRCKAGGESLRQKQSTDVKHGDVIELLENLHLYRVEFSPVPNYSQPTVPDTDTEMVGKQTTLNHFLKRKDPVDLEKLKSCPSSQMKKAKQADSWEEIENGKLIVYTSFGIEAKSKIAAFDLDGTIITTQSGKVFPKNCQDWKLNLSEVPAKLKQLVRDNFKVVLFTNQAGLSNGKVNPAQFRDKLRCIGDKIGIPIQVFISPGSGIYRKPAIGMWSHLIDNGNDNVTVDMYSSFYCGDAAGRQEKWATGKKKDHSSVDRLFALNIGLKFYTPEEYFLGQRPVAFKEPEFKPDSFLSGSTHPLDPPNTPLFIEDQQEVILLVGFPGSGKSHFASQHALQSNYQVINRDTLGSWQKCASVVEKCLDKGQSVLIDNTNPDKESRSRFIRLATARRLPCRCFIMNVSLTHAQHNNKFRELTDSKHATVSRMIYNVYKSKYEEPSTDEGFSQIIKVNFLPQFTSAKEERLYRMFLLED